MNTAVKFFDSTMSGAPELSGTAGTLISVLDACLVNGFGSVTLDSLVVADDVATATVSGGHGFAMVGNTGPVIRIAGATPSALNTDWRIASVPSGTQFTFTTSGIGNQTATGTISAKRASAGWEKRYSGTNKAAYARLSVQATAMLLRVDDSPAQYPTLIVYETMSDVDTGGAGGSTYYFAKSSAASSTTRAWRLIADDQAFYLFGNADGSTWPAAMMFGDILPYRSSDAFHCLLIAHAAGNTTSHLHFVDGTATGTRLTRPYTQLGDGVTGNGVSCGRYSHRGCLYLGAGPVVLPNWADNAVHVWPIQVVETGGAARGEMPGLFCPIHSSLIADGSVLTQGERNLFIQQTYSASYRGALDVTGPWR